MADRIQIKPSQPKSGAGLLVTQEGTPATTFRITPFLGLVLGVSLVAAGLLLSAAAVSQGHQQQRTLQRDAAQVSASFSSYFERARSLDLLLAHDQAFSAPASGVLDHAAANRALGYLEVLYPNAIGEACVINENGREFARVTEGVPAPVSDLSLDEARNPFFAPTLAMKPGEVYQATPYVSPDTGHWVISNSTWIPLANEGRMIVHFEVSLASFIPYVDTSVTSRHVAVVDRSDGRIILQDGVGLPSAQPQDAFPATSWSKTLTTLTNANGTTTVASNPAAYRRIDRSAANANDWYVIEWSTNSASMIPLWAGATTTALGVLLLGLALLLLHRQHVTLRRAARLDHLTGLANRKALEEALDDALTGARSQGESIAVLMLDLDGFKQVNDTLGHDKGDAVLREIARRLHANVFEYDLAGRMGGDEFAVVLRHLRESDDVRSVAHRLREALIRPIEIDGIPRFIGVSVGAAVHPQHGHTVAELLRGADAAMYRAKRGREGVRLYEVGTLEGASALGLAAELLTAIDDRSLHMAFQPEVSLHTGEIVGVEALARWERPWGEEVSPTEFIRLAEATGLIRSLTSLTLRIALDEAMIWHGDGLRVPVSVNLSGRVVGDKSLLGEITELLDERGLNASALVLEITETALITDRSQAIETLQILRASGVRIELDDFGSGYTSFGSLHDLPLDGLKIDRSLVIDTTGNGTRLLAATIENAQNRGLRVVAEGVEDAATKALVRELGCDTAQGYHIARPMLSNDIRSLLRSQLGVADLAGAPPTQA